MRVARLFDIRFLGQHGQWTELDWGQLSNTGYGPRGPLSLNQRRSGEHRTDNKVSSNLRWPTKL